MVADALAPCVARSSAAIDIVEQLGPCLIFGRISTNWIMSMWSNDIKCKYMFICPLKNIAHKGLSFYNNVWDAGVWILVSLEVDNLSPVDLKSLSCASVQSQLTHLRQNGRNFADDIIKRISLSENVRI